ncbi:tandem-95 repeat protein [Schaalia sp. 19OD2882]|uniref:Ig-like domain-containing protein n=1 Tax=Schaalia sp. 19OD2882 TaxID=2794089 RepID=UPI001C1F07FA|nr:Ig-like domain-containing protein [Schaalia sp. 19OD2882]QWW19166.1 tandem-95 repeat protein [Schaalia sp. 19OD2882]
MRQSARTFARQDARRLAGAALIVCVLVVLVAAALNPGVRATHLELDDGGVWVTNPRLQAVAHLNPDARILDSSLHVDTAKVDVHQNGETVFVKDLDTSTLSGVDVAHSTLGGGVANPGLDIAVGGDWIALTDVANGRIWRQSTSAPAVVDREAQVPDLSDLPDAHVTVGSDGAIHAASAKAERVVTLRPGVSGEDAEVWPLKDLRAGPLQIAAVGQNPVVLESDSGRLHLPGGVVVELPGTGFALQESGPASDSVLVSTADALLSVPLAGGEPRTTAASVPAGAAVRPVRLGDCTYGAWARSGSFIRDCGDPAADVSLVVDTLVPATHSVFRVNRRTIVLNDLDNGTLWLPDEKMFLVDDWDQVDSTLKSEKEEEQDKAAERTDEVALPERSQENKTPTANDDEFGVRAGRTNLLPVTQNDVDPDGDVLTVQEVGATDLGVVFVTREGAALQIAVPEGASGATTFEYTVSDGRGGTSTATVAVSVHPDDVNAPPKQLVAQSLSLGVGRSARINALTSWYDPDGDPFYLSGVRAPQGLTARTRDNGALDVTEAGHGAGKDVVTLLVSDGRVVGEGRVDVSVVEGANQAPVTNADHIVVRVGSTATFTPAANDTDPNGDQLRVVQVEPGGDIVGATLDAARGIVTVTGIRPGTTYLGYVVSDGPASTPGFIRVDVVPEESAPPSAEDDIAVLPAVGQVLVDLLANDSDPTGGVLAVQSVRLAPESRLTVALIDRRIARVSAPRGINAPETFTYTVSNGVGSAEASVTVVPGPPLDTTVPPDPIDDVIVVRAEDVAGISVLDNDSSPTGLPLTVQGELQHQIPADVATVFRSGDHVRVRGGSRAGTGTIVYTVADSVGNVASARVAVTVVGADDGTNTAPHPRDLVARTTVGQSVTIPVPTEGIDPEGDSTTLVGMATAPTKGTVERVNSAFVYTPSGEATGTDTFTYVVEDRLGKQGTGTVRVGVSPRSEVNEPPVAEPDEVRVRPGRRVSVDVLANDLDPDGDDLTLVPDSADDHGAGMDVAQKAGRVVLTAPAKEGTHLVTYMVSDGNGGRSQGVLSVLVREQAPLLPPIARDDAPDDTQVGQARRTGTVVLDVLRNDEDPDGDISRATVSSTDSGVRVLDGGRLEVSLADEARIVIYTVTDVDGLAASAVVTVPGRQITRPTVDLTTVPIRARAGEATDIPLNDHIVSRAGRQVILTRAESVSAGVGADGSALVKDVKTLTFRSRPDFSGPTHLTFEVTDGTSPEDPTGRTAILTLPIEVEPTANRAPTIRGTTVRLARGQAATTLDLREVSTDPDSADVAGLRFSLVGGAPAGINASISGATLTMSATKDASLGAVGQLRIAVEDAHGGRGEAAFPLQVSAEGPQELVKTTEARVSVRAGASVDVDIAAYATNPDPARGPLRIVGAPVVNGGVQVSVRGTVLSISAPAGAVGSSTVSYVVVDAAGGAEREVPGVVRVDVQGVPGAPAGVRGEALSTQVARISWTAGPANGSDITSFTVTDHTQGDSVQCGVTTSCDMTGRRGEGVHEFSVTATNAVGVSEASARVRVQMVAAPEQPPAPTIRAGDTTLTIAWLSVEHGLSAPTRYEVRVTGREVLSVPADGSSTYRVDLNGVPNGVSHVAQVRAVNAAGASAWSLSSREVTPYGRPAAVPGFTASHSPSDDGAETGTVELTWASPDPNGRAIEYFTITGAGRTVTVDGTSRRASIHGVPVGGETSFTITATNDRGAPASHTSPPVSTSVIVLGRPPVPSIESVAATGRDAEVRLKWNRSPAQAGWAPADLSYQWSTDGAWLPLTGEILSGNGLRNGAPTNVRIRAVATRSGITLHSAIVSSARVVPYGAPIAPTLECVSLGAKVECSWTGGSGNGREATFHIQDVAEAVGAEGSRTFDAQPGPTTTVCIRVTQAGTGTQAENCSTVNNQQTGPQNPPTVFLWGLRVDGLSATLYVRDFPKPGGWYGHCWNFGPGGKQVDLGPANGGGPVEVPRFGSVTFTCAGNPDDPSIQGRPGSFAVVLTSPTDPVTYTFFAAHGGN